MAYLFTRSDEDLLIVDQRSGEVSYTGRPQGHPVEQVMPLPASDDCIVLLAHERGPKVFRNVLRLGPTGEEVWVADIPEPTGPDAYVEINWDQEAALTASSWSGYLVSLDPESGRIKEAEFVK